MKTKPQGFEKDIKWDQSKESSGKKHTEQGEERAEEEESNKEVREKRDKEGKGEQVQRRST